MGVAKVAEGSIKSVESLRGISKATDQQRIEALKALQMAHGDNITFSKDRTFIVKAPNVPGLRDLFGWYKQLKIIVTATKAGLEDVSVITDYGSSKRAARAVEKHLKKARDFGEGLTSGMEKADSRIQKKVDDITVEIPESTFLTAEVGNGKVVSHFKRPKATKTKKSEAEGPKSPKESKTSEPEKQ